MYTDTIEKILQTGEGILNIYKPVGWTSFEVVKYVRNVLQIKKIGHAGTLDPFAEGVLLLCCGRETKSVTELMDLKKVYSGVMELGRVTNTLDISGNIVSSNIGKNITLEAIKKASQQFVGQIPQTPPMFSAVKVGGKRLYELARQEKSVVRKSRLITIYDFTVHTYEPPLVDFTLECSKGTYVRALAQDFGAELNCDAYLKILKREKIGNFSAREAISINRLRRLKES